MEVGCPVGSTGTPGHQSGSHTRRRSICQVSSYIALFSPEVGLLEVLLDLC